MYTTQARGSQELDVLTEGEIGQERLAQVLYDYAPPPLRLLETVAGYAVYTVDATPELRSKAETDDLVRR